MGRYNVYIFQYNLKFVYILAVLRTDFLFKGLLRLKYIHKNRQKSLNNLILLIFPIGNYYDVA